mgnify:CR=1 FL=1
MINIIIILSIIGVFLSIYAFYIERKTRENKKYKAVCDIGNNASCTKAFSSSYGKMFGISNSLAGIGFYIMIIILTIIGYPKIFFYFSIISLLFTLYLAYVSFFKLKNLCIICSLIYVINILLVIFGYAVK